MAATCSTSVATQTTVATTQSFSTFTSTVVSTLSPGVTTITSTHPCSGGGGSGTSVSAVCSPVVTTVTSSVPGGTTTLTTVGTSTIDVLTTQTTTILNSSCSNFASPSSPLPSEPSTTTSVLIVTNNGQVSTQYIVSTVLPASLQTNQVKTTSGTGKNVGAIVGGVFGGLAGVLLLVLGGLWFIRRRKRWDMIFDKDDNNNAWTPGPGVNDDPYAYGPVGGRRDRLEMDDSEQGRRMVLD